MLKVKRYIGDMVLSCQSLLRYVFSLPFFKIENKIVFINFNGKGFGDNPKYIAEEIIHQKLPVKLIWLVSNKNSQFPNQITTVGFRSVRALYELATAKVIVTNVKNDLRLRKRSAQMVIQTWHGSLSPKKLEKEAENQLSKKYIKESKKNSSQTDIFISNSHLLTEQILESFWYDGRVLECGLPRNDLLVKNSAETREKIREKLCVSTDSFIVLYTPTFRDDGNNDAYTLDCKKVINAYIDKGYSNVEIWIRLHPNVKLDHSIFDFNDSVKNLTDYPDVQELLLATDVLITDYSSTMFDISLLKKPVFIFATDIEKYNQIRGLKPFFYELPYPISRNNDELVENIRRYDESEYIKAVEQFMQKYDNKDFGTATETIVGEIKHFLNN